MCSKYSFLETPSELEGCPALLSYQRGYAALSHYIAKANVPAGNTPGPLPFENLGCLSLGYPPQTGQGYTNAIVEKPPLQIPSLFGDDRQTCAALNSIIGFPRALEMPNPFIDAAERIPRRCPPQFGANALVGTPTQGISGVPNVQGFQRRIGVPSMQRMPGMMAPYLQGMSEVMSPYMHGMMDVPQMPAPPQMEDLNYDRREPARGSYFSSGPEEEHSRYESRRHHRSSHSKNRKRSKKEKDSTKDLEKELKDLTEDVSIAR